jgi:diguanylate cyclase (GGDEF)-like protein
MSLGPPVAGGDRPALPILPAALDRLMPMHCVLTGAGTITSLGPSLRKVAGGPLIPGEDFFARFEVRRPSGIAGITALALAAGRRLRIAPRLPQAVRARLDLSAVGMPLAGGTGMLLNFGFGSQILTAVRSFGLTLADFAPTDLAMELLFLVEAKAAVEAKLKDLNHRLQDDRDRAEVDAMTDTLTGLYNRRAFDLTLERALDAGQPLGLMNIDLDYFKAVNDTHGHAAGDAVLVAAAAILRAETRVGDFIARIGGDEFVIVFPGLTEAVTLKAIADRIVARISEPIPVGTALCRISASIGISLSTAYPRPTADRLLGDADAALYASKHAGRGRAHLSVAAREPGRSQARQG